MAGETELERMVIRLMGDGTSYQSMLNSAQAQTTAVMGQMSSQNQSAGLSLTSLGRIGIGVFGALTAAATAYLSVTSAISFVKWGVSLANEAEQAEMAFTTMLGSAEKARGLVKNIQTFAAETPLDTGGITRAAKTLLQFGISGDEVMGTMKALGDVAAGDENRFQSMALAFGQMSSAGRLMGQDLLQMINAGFNPLQQMSKDTGKSMKQLKDDMEAGKISVDMVKKAFINATSDGGTFNDMMGKQAKTLGGVWAKAMDDLAAIARTTGQELIKTFGVKEALGSAAGFLKTFNDNWKENLQALIDWSFRMWGRFSEGFMSIFGGLTDYAASGWTYMRETLANFVLNGIGFFANFTENIKIGFAWIRENWFNILKDMGQLFVVTWQNQLTNLTVILETMMRLWQAFGGYLYGLWKQGFSFQFVDAVLTGLIKVGEYIRQWALNISETISRALRGDFSVQKGSALDSMNKAFKEELGILEGDFKGGKNNGFINQAGKILEEQLGKVKLPTDGFVSSLKDMPKFNMGVDGLDLPEFVWKEGQKAGTSFGDAFGKNLGGMKAAAQEAGKVTDAVLSGSTEALARMQEFRAKRIEAVNSSLSVKDGTAGKPPSPSEKSLAKIEKGIEALVKLGEIQAGEPAIQFDSLGLGVA